MMPISRRLPFIRKIFRPRLPILFCLLHSTFAAQAQEPVDSVNPFIGTGGSGHTYPGAAYPFGLVQLSPDTDTWGWSHCSGYRYEDPTIMGFSLTHLSGTGGADLGDILFQPTTGAVRLDCGESGKLNSGYRSTFLHTDESASPGYYRVLLKDYEIKAELTATAHVGIQKYTFPASDRAHIIIDLAHGIGSDPQDAALIYQDERTICGYRRSSGWAHDKTIYFVAKFSRSFPEHVFVADGIDLPGGFIAKGKEVKGHLDFKTKEGDVILIQIGVSPVSIEQARKNLGAEIGSAGFEATVAKTRAAWNQALKIIRIETPDSDLRQTFYTALYHSMLAPHVYNDFDGTYRGADGKAHAADFQYYSTFSIWDQFRAWHPLMTILQPGRVNDFLKSFLSFYEQESNHALPVWPLCSNETGCMTGYHSLPIILDAYAKGFRDYDVDKVYAAMRDTALRGRENHDEYVKNGFIATLTEGHDTQDMRNYKQSVSTTLDYAFDDWCMARMAHFLGKKDDEDLFLKRAANYKNVYNPETGFMQGKTVDGHFITPFDPKAWYRADYTESNAWQSSFFVPHDPRGLIQLMGGDVSFIEKIDHMFSEDSQIHLYDGGFDISGLIGQYAHGNEPVHNLIYLYSYAGAPYKTQQRIRQVMGALYTNKPDGLCGNDDCGQMSAWYVFSSLGFYPANPADENYIIGSPLVDKAVIRLNPKYYGGGTFTITAKDNSKDNLYIQSATLNGQSLSRTYFTHAELVKGGELVFQMGPNPNKSWGQAPGDRPPSMTDH